MPKKITDYAENLWSRVDKSGDCWLWTGNRSNLGYGNITPGLRQRIVYVHRFAYELTHGPIPEGMKVCHTCDVRHCCNPAHLFLGTQGDNIRDAVAKGRMNHKYSAEVVVRARLLAQTHRIPEVARMLDIPYITAYGLIRGKRRVQVDAPRKAA